ncbi:MAG TPA: hypothetical protein VES62_07470 [Thermoleophilaceae bacterium]|nr:hypothetical protein [Thermoleophilaceae bacterium]
MAAGPELQLVREIRTFWQLLNLERFCPLTARLLKRLKRYEAAVEAYAGSNTLPFYRQELGPQFLAYVAAEMDDDLIRAVAAFELAMLRAKRPEPGEWSIDWPASPYQVLASLLGGAELHIEPGRYRTLVSAQYKQVFVVQRLD